MAKSFRNRFNLVTRAIALLATVFTVVACSTSPKGRKQLLLFPEDQMSQLGVQSFQEMKTQIPTESDPRVNSYVKCVALPITQIVDRDYGKTNWEIVVFKDESANAFALPGGKIGVHTGLLKVAQTPAQLAAVVGHEVGHVIAKHGNERVSETFAVQGGLAALSGILSSRGKDYGTLMAALGVGSQFGVLLPHGRSQESEADVIGLELMAKAGFDPRQSIDLWQNMAKAGGSQPPEFLSTHPSHETRISNLKANMPQALSLYQQGGSRNPASSSPDCKL